MLGDRYVTLTHKKHTTSQSSIVEHDESSNSGHSVKASDTLVKEEVDIDDSEVGIPSPTIKTENVDELRGHRQAPNTSDE